MRSPHINNAILFGPDYHKKVEKLFLAPKLGMWPWVSYKLDMMTNYDLDFNRYRVSARVRGNGWDFSAVIPVDREDVFSDPDWVQKAHDALVMAFRNRWSLPIPDNIVLGEN